MRRRPEPADVELASARLVAVLGGTGLPALGGWVPPSLEEAPAVIAAAVRPSSEEPPSVAVPLPPAQPVPTPEGARDSAALPPTARGPEPPLALGAGAGPGAGWRGLLPESLVGGRVDPGRSGVLALVAVAVVAALVAGGVLLRGRPQEVSAPTVLASGGPLPGASAAADGQVVVAVAGKVRKPGIVRLPAGSRVDDAVRAAGGIAPGASPGLLNLARRLVDGEQVLVGVEAAPAGPGAPAAGGLLDLNTATAEQLDDLPGVGPVLAGRIVDWRTEHGRFASVDQLREVSGIGESKYASMKSKVRV